uniref:Ribosomal protein S3 n=1 Tax=Ulva compressa TaxID=63659 RepID=A0A493QL33_ULVCO|nr:ribosomal protein S3 [Ulva compressa]
MSFCLCPREAPFLCFCKGKRRFAGQKQRCKGTKETIQTDLYFFFFFLIINKRRFALALGSKEPKAREQGQNSEVNHVINHHRRSLNMTKALHQSLKKNSSLIQYSFANVYNPRSICVFNEIKPALVIYILASHFAFDLSNLQTVYLENKIIQASFKRHFLRQSGGLYKLQTAQFVLHCLKIATMFHLKQNKVYQQNLFGKLAPLPLGLLPLQKQRFGPFAFAKAKERQGQTKQLVFNKNNAKLFESKYSNRKNIPLPIDIGPLMIKPNHREEVYKIAQPKSHNITTQIKWDSFYASNLMCANWILDQVVQLLSNSDKKSPRPVLNQYINDIRILIRSMGSICPILGIRIAISGRLGSQKKAMAQQISKCVGKVPLSTLRQNVGYSQSFVRTKFGVIGVSVWVCYRGN